MGRKKLVKSENLVEGSKFLVRAGYSYWTLGYILSESGAKKLIDAMPLKKLIPVDEFLPILSDTHPEYVKWLMFTVLGNVYTCFAEKSIFEFEPERIISGNIYTYIYINYIYRLCI